jgi:hypothetical protein
VLTGRIMCVEAEPNLYSASDFSRQLGTRILNDIGQGVNIPRRILIGEYDDVDPLLKLLKYFANHAIPE